MRARIVVAVVGAVFLALAAQAQQNAFVVDSDGRAVANINLSTGAVESKVALPFTPDFALLAPDGKTILALHRGPGSYAFVSGEFRPKGKSVAAVIADGKVTGAPELGWGLAEAAFSTDGRSAYVLTTGYETNKAAEFKQAELLRLDTATGKVEGRIAFEGAAQAFATDTSGTTGIVFSPAFPKKKPTPLPARVTFVDLGAFTRGDTIDISGDVRKPVAVGDLLYVLDRGSKTAGGKLYIIDGKRKTVAAAIAVGPEAVMGGSDREGRVFVLSQAADLKSGRVTVVRATEVVGEHPGPAAPKIATLSEDGKRLYVAGWKEFAIADLAGGKSVPATELARSPLAMLSTKDGRRAFIVSMDGDQCCRISTFDTEGQKRLTTFLGGSKGERFGQVMVAALISAASYQAGQSLAQASGSRTFYYSIYTPRSGGAARGPLAFGPDEKKVYLVDTQTNDVTIVDVATGERIATLDAGSGLKEVVPLHQAGVIAGIADSDITLVDTTSDLVRATIPLKGQVIDAITTPDERHLVVFGKERVVVLDMATAKEVARIETLKRPTQVLFQNSRSRK